MKKNFGTRMVAILLAVMMIITSQTFMSLGETLGLVVQAEESRQDESGNSQDAETYQEGEDIEPSGENPETVSVPDETYQENGDTSPEGQNTEDTAGTSGESGSSGGEDAETSGESPKSSEEESSGNNSLSGTENTETLSGEGEETPGQPEEQQERQETAPAETPAEEAETPAPAPLDHTDGGTGVRLTADEGVVPADASVSVAARPASELPGGAEKAVDNALKDEGLSAVEKSFYDISLGDGVQPVGNVQVWIPVSDSFDVESQTLDAWYIDDAGNAENLKEADSTSVNANARLETDESGQRFYVFETDHFSLYGVTRSEAELTVSISPDHDTASYGDQIVIRGNVSGTDASLQWQYRENEEAEWKDINGETGNNYTFSYSEENAGYQYRLKAVSSSGTQEVYSNEVSILKRLTLEEAVEEYYGENGTQDTVSVSARLDEATSSFKAGESFTLNIEYLLKAAALFNYGDQAEPMFDSYENTVITLQLPEGLSIDLSASDPLDNVERVEGPLEGNVYKFYLNDDINVISDVTGSFLVDVTVDGNGKQETGHAFEFSGEYLTIESSFTIQDYDGDKIKKVNPTESALNTITTTTDDEWMITKTPSVQGFEFSEDDQTVTVHFDLEVGLKQSHQDEETDETVDSIISNPESYARTGRVPFDGEVTLTEIPTVKDREGNPLTAQSITVTPNFGEEAEIEVPLDGSGITLPVDTCGSHNLSGVDAAAPYYSTYTVDIVYDAEKFIAKYSDADQSDLIVDNTATITYRLSGESESETSEANAQQDVGKVTPPAELELRKYIVPSTAGVTTSKLYSSTNFPSGDPVKGKVQLKITAEDGSTPTLYTRNGDGTYSAIEGADGIVTFDPLAENESGALSKDGTLTVYLDAGKYTVTEIDTADNTDKITAEENADQNADDKTVEIAAGEKENAFFYNKETLGTITINKEGTRDGVTGDLAGAEFGLYSDKSCTDDVLIGTVTTGTDGSAEFERLQYGTYYVKEISAPSGYRIDQETHQVEISGENPSVTVESVNLYNQAYVRMQKQIMDYDTNDFVNVNASTYEIFANCFTLQRTTDTEIDGDTVWENVTTDLGNSPMIDIGLTQDGQILTALPVYADNGDLYTYRFMEKLPDGWHGAGETTDADSNRIFYSPTFDLADEIGNSAQDNTASVTMWNWRNGSITVTKQFWDAGKDGMSVNESSQATANFDLYYKVGKDSSDYIKWNQDGSYTLKAGGSLTIEDLHRTQGQVEEGADLYYYLVETAGGTEGYELSSKTSGFAGTNIAEKTTITVGGEELTAFGPFNFTEGFGDSKSIQLQQSITIDNVEQKVPVVISKEDYYSKAFVSGTRYSIYEYDENAEGHIGTPVAEYQNVDIVSGGSLAELATGKKYIVVETQIPDGYTDMTEEAARIIDLTDVTVDTDTKTKTVTIVNRPDPKIRVTKQIQKADGSTQTLTGVVFEVYTKTSSGFEPVMGYDGTTPLTLSSGSTLQLPAGTYYLKEVVPEGNSNHVLDPSKYSSVYGTEDGEYDEATDSYYFGEYKVADQAATQELGTILNYSDLGAVRVVKYEMTSQGKTVALQGAEISIYRKDGETETLVSTQTSAQTTGRVTFENLQIYDENGDKITYVIRETKAPSGYTVSDEELEVTLTPGETVTTDGEDELSIINQPETSLRVSKVYYNIWEHQFTNKEYLLSGTEIALYRLEEDGKYHYVETKKTNEIGEVTFTGLAQKCEYAAVEVSIPEGESYQYLEPEDGKEYLKKTDGKVPDTIEESEINKYNIVTKQANTGNPVGEQTGTLVNVENWTQLQIKKFVTETEGANIGEERLINNAEFILYQQNIDLNDGQGTTDDPTDRNLQFDEDNPDLTVIGTYSSGTLYDADGVRMDGYFATDILKSADNVVYWLVETNAGIGASINPATAITLVKREGTNYTNTSIYTDGNGTETPSVEEIVYQDNTRTQDSVENTPEYGPGSAMFSTVRIAKWAGSYDSEGNKVKEYTPLGNATFDLYLATEDGTLVEKLDTLTTGLDNDLSENTGDGEEEQTEKSAWASSRAFSWEQLTELYKEDPRYNEIFATDKDNNGYVRVALVETSAPAGYLTGNNTYYMLMFFENKAQTTTESFNDVFYVKDAAEDVTLAEDQEGIVWSLYPTAEDQEDKTYSKITIEHPLEDATEGQYRLVNWPVDNFAVTVTDYGYEVDAGTLNKGSDELNEHYATGTYTDRVALANVTLRLERLVNGQWQAYTYDSYDGSGTGGIFTTDENGYFAFPKGLNIGEYRIVEVNMGENSGYENVYDLADNNTTHTGSVYSQAAYYFRVTADNVDITLYNPKKLSLDIKKTDTTGEKNLAGVTFTLSGSSGTITGTTDADGAATLSGIGNGTYKLSETAAAGYSNTYFGKYFAEEYGDNDVYPDLNKLVNGSGIFFGFNTSEEINEDGTYGLKVTEVTDISSYGIDASKGVTLTVENPEKQGLTIRKLDKDTSEPLADAVFKVEYQPFPTYSGNVSVADSGWTAVNTSAATGSDGNCVLNNLEPGVYKITETSAPDNYDKDTTPQYVALTGGMNIGTVTVGDTTIDKNTDEEFKDGVVLTFRDNKKVNLTVTKTINSGDLSVNGDHAFSFTLYDSRKQVIETKSVTCEDGADGQLTFAGLSQGGTYYLKETAAAEGFTLTGMKDGSNAAMTPDDDGYYTIHVPMDNADLSVTAENTYLYAEVSILKVNGETGETLEMSGADFAAYEVNDGTQAEDPRTDIDFTYEENGVYTAVVPLAGTDGETFRIYETQAPANYLRDTASYIEVTLKPGEKLEAPTWSDAYKNDNTTMLADRIFPNYKGAYVDLVKYNNVKESNPGAEDVQSGVTFTLYEKSGDGWITSADGTTDEDGKIHLTVSGGKIYAIAEVTPPAGYQGLQGIWSETGENPEGTVDNNGQTLHLINGGEPLVAGITYNYKAYDIPYVEVEIRKQNALDPAASTQPTAVVSIYEISAEDAADLEDADVEKLLQSGTPVLSDINVETAGSENGERFSYANASTATALGSSFIAGKTYLVVETDSNVSQIRDDNRVIWYNTVTIPEGSTEKQAVTLKNIAGTVDSRLSKTAANNSYESLFTQGASLQYTLTPRVGNNTYPLDSFTLTDTGLTAYHEGQTSGDYQVLNGYLKEKYSVTELTIRSATHIVDGYLTAGSAPIMAEVTFYDHEGKPLGNIVTRDISSAAATVTPQDAGIGAEENAASFQIRYYSEALTDAAGYALGTNFTPGTVTVKMSVDQQEGGEGVMSIDRIVNRAETETKYTPWNTQGSKADQQTIDRRATAGVTFDEQNAAIARVTKMADKETVSLEDTVTYTIRLTNDEGADAAMESPFIVDLLPQGSTLADSNVEVTSDDDSIKLSNVSTGRSEGETAVFVYLEESLGVGKYVDIKLSVKAEQAVAGYGTTMQNYVLAGSNAKGAQSDDNPQSASFKNGNGNWAESMDSVLTSLEADRKEALRAILQNSEMENYGYISAYETVNWASASDMSLVKSGYGDRNSDTGYVTDLLATVENGGTMYYRLSVSNTSGNSSVTDVSMVDILPAKGDYRVGNTASRASEWQLYLGEIGAVSKVGTAGETSTIDSSLYKVYYYTGTTADYSEYQNVYEDAKTLKFETSALPEGWTDARPSDAKSVRAIAVAFSDEVTLSSNESLTVEYTARVNGGEPYDTAELSENAYKNAVNSFACHYSTFTTSNPTPVAKGQVLGSNVISNTILPERVKVGGHIWIDKNANGVWEEDESIDNFTDNSLIQQLLNNLEIRLWKYDDPYTLVGIFNQAGNENWSTDANFVFEDLDPAMKQDDVTDDELYGEDGTLDVSKLKGTDPAAYQIAVTLTDDAIQGKYKLTKEGDTNGRSRNPQEIPEAEQKDSNFTSAGNTNVSELFYLWATDADVVFDNTKDIGLIPYRDLAITKKAEDGAQPVVEGASFEVYGPFDEGEAAEITEEELAGMEPVAEGTTDENGTFSVSDTLLWYKEYLIVETSPAAGYTLEGAAATTDDTSSITAVSGMDNPTWVLGIPSDQKTDTTDRITVTNKRTVDIQLGAEKTLKKNNEAQQLSGGEYSFELRDKDNVVIDTAVNAADGTVTFKNITLEGEGTFTYYINEVVPKSGVRDGVTYDQATYRVTVTTTWKDGTGLEASYKYEKQEPEETGWTECSSVGFENVYNATGTWTPSGEKTLTGRDMKDQEVFHFVVTENGKTVSTGTATGGKDGVATDIQFSDVNYDVSDVGDHTYQIKEVDAEGNTPVDGNGLSYATDPVEVTVHVSDNGDGTLTASAEYPDEENGAVFTNRYVPAPIDYTPGVNKIMGGSPLVDDETFGFSIRQTDGPNVTFENDKTTASVTYPASEDGTAGGEKSATFGKVTFTEKGTYVFEIRETTNKDSADANQQISYDDATWTLTIVVADDGNGTLSRTSTVYKSGKTEDENSTGAEFFNTYTPVPATAELSVTKEVEGNAIPAGQTFKFTLAKQSETTEGGAVLPEDTELEIQVNETGKAVPGTFDPITFNAAGIYTFTITEDTGNVPDGYEYDTVPVRTVTVRVTDVGGRLETEVTYSADDRDTEDVGETYVNRYEPEEAHFTPAVKKSFTIGSGETLPEAVKFQFQMAVKEDPETPENGVIYEEKDLTAETGDILTASDNILVNFGELAFTKAGVYYFTITETPDTADYAEFTYDGTEWTLKVVVQDMGGHLKVNEDETTYTCERVKEDGTGTEIVTADQAEFANSYTAAPTEYSPKAAKEITSAFEPEKKAFTFHMSWNEQGTNSGVTMPENTSLTVNGEESGSFDAITFTRAGTYTFDISEDSTDIHPGYSYDTGHWTLTVTVDDQITEDEETGERAGQLTVTDVQYSRADTGETSDEQAVFTNTYAVTQTDSITPKAEKVIEGDPRPDNKTFVFQLTPDADNTPGGASLEGKDTVVKTTVEGSGESTFDEIEFFKPGSYIFHITEEDTDENGYTYDESHWILNVKVEDHDSVLEVTDYSYEKEGSDAADPDSALFENVYSVTGTEYIPQVTKTVTGDVPEGRDQTFRFELTEKPGNPEGAVLPDDTEAEVTGSGETAFDAIGFEQAGIYQFQICETNDGIAGYTYDGAVWTLTVEVTDNNSTLEVTDVVWEKDGVPAADVEAAAFENSYSTTEIGYAPQVEKVITGDETPDDRTFTFNLEADAENPEGAELNNGRAVSDGAGMTGFEEITFTKTGTYRFVITETAGEDTGYTYDGTKWTLTVQVEDEGGALAVRSAEYTAEGKAEGSEHVIFENSYDAEPVSYAPEVRKTVNGDVPEGRDQTFTFTLAGSPETESTAKEQTDNGDEQAFHMPEDTTAEITGSGKASFDEIVFDKAGDYSFEIREEIGNVPGYSYDGTVWNLTVHVSDQGGKLVIEDAVYERAGENGASSDTAQFVNTYDPKAVSYAPRVTKRIDGDETPNERTFWFNVEAMDENTEGAAAASSKAGVTGAGSTSFENIRFTKAGTYRFMITETKGSDSGYTYDESRWVLTVTVEDVDGVLAVSSAVYAKSGTDETNTQAAVFVNHYDETRSAAAAAKTGDGADFGKNVALLTGSAVLLWVLLLERRRRKSGKQG